MSLLHHNDGGFGVTAAGVGLEVFLHRDGCGFLLLLIGVLPDPEEDLGIVQGSGESEFCPSWPTGLCLGSPRLRWPTVEPSDLGQALSGLDFVSEKGRGWTEVPYWGILPMRDSQPPHSHRHAFATRKTKLDFGKIHRALQPHWAHSSLSASFFLRLLLFIILLPGRTYEGVCLLSHDFVALGMERMGRELPGPPSYLVPDV